MNECQAVDCHNAGKLVTCIINIEGQDEKHEIYMCRNHIVEQNLINGKSN